MAKVREELKQYQLYSVKDLEPVLGRSAQTIKAYLRAGKLKGAIVAGQWKVTEEALREFLGLGPK
jgi:predicted site-specific integrase-resolvase